MALIKVYEWDFYSNLGSRYKIELHQEGGSPITSGLGLASDGFVMTSKADEDNRFSPIIGTEVEIPILIEDQTAEVFINGIVINQEKDSFIKIFAWNGSDWVIFWRGIVLQDLASFEDNYYPYQHTIRATDGLGRLKGLEFSNAGNPYTGDVNLIVMLRLLLTKAGTFGLYGVTDNYISTCVNFVESNADSGDIMANMRVMQEAFYTIDSNGATFLDSYEVLKQICLRFGLRCYQENGSYHFVSVTNFENITNQTFYHYGTGTNLLGTESKKVILENIKWNKSSGSNFNLYPSLNRVLVKYKYRQSHWPQSLIPTFPPYTAANYSNITADSDTKLRVRYSAQMNYLHNGTNPSTFYGRVQVKVNVGSYYLVTDGFNVFWSTSVGGYITYLYAETTGFSADTTSSNFVQIDLITPVLPSSGLLGFEAVNVSYVDINGNSFTLPSGASTILAQVEAQVMLYDADFAEGVKVTEAINTISGTPTENSSEYEVEELILGDAQHSIDVGRIQVYDGSNWVNSSEWDVGTEYGGISIDELLANEIMSGQRTPTRWNDLQAFLLKNTTFAAATNPVTLALYDDASIFVPLSVAFNAGTDDISGTWFTSAVVRTFISNQEAVVVDTAVGQLPSGTGRTSDIKTFKTFSLVKIASVSTPIAAGTITSIPITAIGDGIVSKGDVLQLVDPTSGESESVTVSANQEASDTSISVNSVTLANGYGIGSYLTYNGAKQVRKASNPRLTTQTLTTDGSVGVFDVTVLNGASSAVSASLPRAADAKNKTFTIKCISSVFACSVASVDSIEGQSSIGLRKGEVLKVYSNGTTWQIVAAIQRTQSVKFISDASYDESIDPAEMRWNSEDGTVEIGMGYDNVTQQVGLEIYYRVKNQTGNRILDGTVVMYDGSVGASGIIKAKPADSTLAAFPHALLGVATMNIDDGEDGFVTHFGLVRGINTASFSDGDILYWNPSVTGGLTATKPTAPNPAIIVAAVVKAHSNGTILVRPCHGMYLYDLHDVAAYDPATLDNESAQIWDSTDKVWKTQVLNRSNWDLAYDKRLSSASFSTSTGVVTLTLADSSTVTVDIDGRYILSSEKGAANGVATLDSSGKLPASQLPTSVLTYMGTWDASSNTPTLADGTGTAGNFYIVSVTGTQDLGSGNITFAAGDWVVYNGSIWEKTSNTSAVTSVNSYTGAVVLTTSDITEGTNLYYTEARVSANTDVAANTAARHTHSNKTTLDSITGTKVSNWDTAYGWGDHAGLYDALGSGAVAVSSHESTYNHTNFATAYSWGNHAAAGYLTTESDPIFTASAAYSITSTQISNWDDAYSWGDWSTGVNKTFIDALNVDADTLDGNDSAYFYPASNPSGFTTNAGTVTSVGLSMPTGFSVTNSPVTTSNTLTVAFASGYKLLTTTAEANYNAAYNDKINNVAFNTSNGVITFTQQDAGTLTVDIDGRFELIGVAAAAVTSHESTYNHANFATAYGWGNWATGVNKAFIDALNVDADTLDGNDSAFFYPASNPNGYTTNVGTVTSVAISVPIGLVITSGSPITTNGTIAIGLQSGYTIPATALQSVWSTAYNNMITAASFATGTGILTLTQQDLGTITVDLDGRYLESFTETDPIYTASTWYTTTNNSANWDTAYGWGNHAGLYDLLGAASTAVGSHESIYNHSNYNTAYSWGNHATAGYLTTETDPIFTASDAYGITSTDIGNWDTAYGWGDHAGLYDLSGAASTAISTHESTYNHANFATAYGWGNHASAGYMVAASYPDLTAIEALTGTGLLRRTGVNTWALDGSANLGVHTFLLDVSRSESALVGTSDFYTLHMPYDSKIVWVMATVTERPLGQSIIIDITDNGASIFNTLLSIDDGAYSSYSSANPYDLASDTIDADHQVIIDVTQVGTTQRGAGLKVYICVYKA